MLKTNFRCVYHLVQIWSMFLNLFGLDEPKLQTPKEHRFFLDVNGKDFPVKIIVEDRFNCRVSINNQGVIIRLSKLLSKSEQKIQADKFLKWAKEKLGDKPQLMDELPQRVYHDGEIMRIGGNDFHIHIFYHNSNKSNAKIVDHNIVLNLTTGLKQEVLNNTVSYLVSRCLCKYFQPIIEKRVLELNNIYIKKEIKNVKLKYNTTNWGSCSSQGNINFSVRLMFAPPHVIDYVIIHELVHLIHMNHSAAFWNKVGSIMPDYELCEKHLKEFHMKYYL